LATVVAATAALGLISAGPALAQETVSIQPGQVPTTAMDFDTHECDGPFEDLADDLDGWHFIAPGQSGFESLTLTFDTPGGEVIVEITSDDPDNPSSNGGWSGYFSDAGPNENHHAWVFTDAGWTLTAGEAEVDEDGQQDFFVLSHTCPGVPTTPTPTPTETETPTPPPTTPPTTPPTEDGETPKPVPTEVPAGYGQADNGSAGTMGLIAFATALAIGGAALVSRRFLKDN
ncbi:MAG TPA: hypothetical protein VFR23_06475, partial [Jiangellaceae bacterium]|nr:hypothetical protein [Jiangellaceae bacterium]